MSKINAVRLINVNYNNNANRISDECLHFNGESTLISLQNGGGKSVLVQMMTAPFVHARHRNAKDRPFEGYFTTNKPSFILVEWVLDQNAGYVLTGLMIRRAQEIQEGKTEDLDVVSIISEYQDPCIQDIHHLPVVEKGKKEMVLKSFHACRQLFENYKKDHSMKFFCYDMTNYAQSRQYFEKLMEYQINYKEWETIIKKVNRKESGLSELFVDCRDEKGLMEKWFLEAVESKLNKDRNRIKEFQSILEKYAGQYKENRSKIKRRDTIRMFKEEAEKIRKKAEKYQAANEEEAAQENKIAWLIHDLDRSLRMTEGKHQKKQEEIDILLQEISKVEYEELSSKVYELEDQKDFHMGNRDMIDMERDSLSNEEKKIERTLHLFSCARQQQIVDDEKLELDTLREKIMAAKKQGEDLQPERNRLGAALKKFYGKQVEDLSEQMTKIHEKTEEITKDAFEERQRTEELEDRIRKCIEQKGSLESLLKIYGKEEGQYNRRYNEELTRNILGIYEPGTLTIRQKVYEQELTETLRKRTSLQKELENFKEKKRSFERDLQDQKEALVYKKTEIEKLQEQVCRYEKELEVRKAILKYLDLEESDLFDTEKIRMLSRRKLEELDRLRRKLEKEENILEKEYANLTSGKILELPKEFEKELEALGIHTVYGMDWLKKNGYSFQKNQEFVRQNPFLPYALILSRAEIEKLSVNGKDICTSFPVPIVEREKIENTRSKTECMAKVIDLSNVSFYLFFNEKLLDEQMLQEMIYEKEQQIGRIRESVNLRRTEYEEYFERQEVLKNQSVTEESWKETKKQEKSLVVEQQELQEKIRKAIQELAELKNTMEDLQNEILRSGSQIEWQKQRMYDFEQLKEAYTVYEEHREALNKCKKEEGRWKENQKLSRDRREKLLEQKHTLELEADSAFKTIEKLKEEYQKYERYELDLSEKADEVAEDVVKMQARYAAITAAFSLEL